MGLYMKDYNTQEGLCNFVITEDVSEDEFSLLFPAVQGFQGENLQSRSATASLLTESK